MTLSNAEIEDAIKELHDAVIESIEAQKIEGNAKLRRIKAHKRLLMAREVVRALKFNY